MARQRSCGPQFVRIAEVLRLAAGEVRNTGLGFGGDRGLLARPRQIIERRHRAMGQRPLNAASDDAPLKPAHRKKRWIFLGGQQHPCPLNPSRWCCSRASASKSASPIASSIACRQPATLLEALAAFSSRSDPPELMNALLLLWGMSAGGEFNYGFTSWKPERVVAFVVNKGGIYFSALLPAAARRVSGLLFVGEEDLESRKRVIAGLFALNRRASALWALAEDPRVAHVVGRSQEMAAIFFDAVLSLSARVQA